MKSIVEFSRQIYLAHTETIRLIIEVQNGYKFPVFEMEGPPDRVPTIAEAIRIIAIARKLHQSPEDLFTDFYARLQKADAARMDYTNASIADVIETYSAGL